MPHVSLSSGALSGVCLLVCLIGDATRVVLNGFPIVRVLSGVCLLNLFNRGATRGVFNGFSIILSYYLIVFLWCFIAGVLP